MVVVLSRLTAPVAPLPDHGLDGLESNVDEVVVDVESLELSRRPSSLMANSRGLDDPYADEYDEVGGIPRDYRTDEGIGLSRTPDEQSLAVGSPKGSQDSAGGGAVELNSGPRGVLAGSGNIVSAITSKLSKLTGDSIVRRGSESSMRTPASATNRDYLADQRSLGEGRSVRSGRGGPSEGAYETASEPSRRGQPSSLFVETRSVKSYASASNLDSKSVWELRSRQLEFDTERSVGYAISGFSETGSTTDRRGQRAELGGAQALGVKGSDGGGRVNDDEEGMVGVRRDRCFWCLPRKRKGYG